MPNVARKIREAKQNTPQNFCSYNTCLWRIRTRKGINPCPKHSVRLGAIHFHKCSICSEVYMHRSSEAKNINEARITWPCFDKEQICEKCFVSRKRQTQAVSERRYRFTT